MIVAVEKHLTELKSNLAKLGYEIVNYQEYQYPVDAVVYSKANDYDGYTSILNSTITGLPYGVLMVNAHHKSVNQIDQILKSRLYGPIF